MENQKQKKSVGTVLLVILLLIVTIASLILATYAWAKYTSQETGSATVQVAKWDVGVEFTGNDFTETYTHVIAKRLAPGSSGNFVVKVDPKTTEVDFKYEITLDKLTAEGGNVPKHLHFYIKDTTGAEVELQQRKDCEIEIGEECSSQTASVKEYLSGEITDKQAVTKTIYWEWPYENPDPSSEQGDSKGVDETQNTLTGSANGIPDYDDQDTLDGMKAGTVKVDFKVKATQLNPNE